MSSNLDALRKRGRAERKNPIPPSLHTPRTTPVTLPEPSVDDTATAPDTTAAPVVDEAPQREQQASPVAPQVPAEQPAPVAAPPARQTNVVTEKRLLKKTLFMGPEEDAFLREIVAAGQLHPEGKVDANQSATIRLALRRLRAEMTPAEVVEEIKGGLNKTGESGRPRF